MKKKTVAFQGKNGAYSEISALKYFNNEIETVPYLNFEDVFAAVKKGKVDFGIVPIENSLAGSIHQNYDNFLDYKLSIIAEIKLRVSHNLIVNKGVSLKDIKEVYSHPQALAQCGKFLKSQKRWERVSANDTAGSVLDLKENKSKNMAAIASVRSAKIYDMKILKKGIEDYLHNFTRFLIISKKVAPKTEKSKTSIVFALKNIPGALFKGLSVFALRDIDLYKIESRPMPGSTWKYIFYVDFSGHISDDVVKKAIDHLKEITTFFKLLGSYPIGKDVSE